MNKLWYVCVNLCVRSFLSKHVRKNKAPLLIANFVLDLFASDHQCNNKTRHGRTHTHHFNNVFPKI